MSLENSRENYVATTSLGWLGYAALSMAIIIFCGGTCVCTYCCECVHCCAFLKIVFNFILVCLTTLKRVLVAIAQPVQRPPAANEPPAFNYILDLRPDHDVNISQMISDIVDVWNQALPDYPAPERRRKHRRLSCKVDVKGWRHKLNKRWKKKMKFIKAMVLYHFYAKDMSNNEFPNESGVGAGREITENSNYSNSVSKSLNSRESHLEEFYMAPCRDEDDDLIETLIPNPPKVTMLKAKPDGTWVANRE